MPEIRRILVVVDPVAETQPAIAKAAQIAATLGSALELYVCDVETESPHRRRLLQEMLDGYAAPLRARGIIVTTGCEWHAPLEQGIGYHVLRTRPDLVVKEARPYAAGTRDSRVLADWALIAQLPCPLLLVRERSWSGHPSIAVSIDPCHPADRPESLDLMLISLGCLLANGLRGGLEAWHVIEAPPHLPGEPATPLEIARASGAARERVDRVVSLANNLPAAIPTRYLDGPIADALARNAREFQPDVLLLGTAARPRWTQLAASGTAARLLEQLPCDVLVMKPEGFVSPLLVQETLS